MRAVNGNDTLASMTSTVRSTQARRGGLARGCAAGALALLASLAVASGEARAAVPPIKHVFVIVLENEGESTSFGPSAPSPYLAQTLPSMGMFLPHYYAVGHNSLDNYLAMVSGQAPNPKTEADCNKEYDGFPGTELGAYEQLSGEGCVYPSDVRTVAGQLEGAGDTWKGYMQSMPKPCSHPASLGEADAEQGEGTLADPLDTYATRHDPFVWFQSITASSANCEAHVVNLSNLEADLASVSTTPNLSFITPDVCYDGHDGSCHNPAEPGLFSGINAFLGSWVPKIVGSAAFQQNGLLVVTFDEADIGDKSACCGETTTGGGDVGAVLVSPFIKPGTTSTTSYNHYSLLASVEAIFGLPRLGDAAEPSITPFGSDVFNPTEAAQTAPTTVAATALQITNVRESVNTWREGAALPHLSATHGRSRRPPVGTTFSFDLNEAATVTLSFATLAPGREAGGTCAAPTRRNRHRHPCTRSVANGALTVAAHTATNVLSFDGVIAKHDKLRTGRHTVTITALAAGKQSIPVTLPFTIATR
jgi:hypothetical protein